MLSAISNLSSQRKLILFCAAIAVALSWTGSLDHYPEEYLDEALKSGAVVYATARGINAAVSLIQGTEITPALATFTVGEVLDPVNDLIERFSAMLLLALGSLALQKILLNIFSDISFSLLVTGLALLVLLTSLSTRFSSAYDLTLKAFMITIGVRFALSLVVMANGAVDQAFLSGDDKDRLEAMTKLEGELRALGNAQPGAPTEEEVVAARVDLKALRDLQSEQQRSVEKIRGELNALIAERDEIRSDVPLTCRLNPWCDEGAFVNAKKMEILAKEAALNVEETAKQDTDAKINEKRKYLECAEQQQAGESCSFWGRAYSWVSPSAWIDRFAKVGDRMDYYADNIISLLVSFLAKTVLIPLVFLYSIIQLYKAGLARIIPKA